MIARDCERCGIPFVSGRAHARFCSERCRQRARDARRDSRLPRRWRRAAQWRAKAQRKQQRELQRRIADPAYREMLSAKLRRKQKQDVAMRERAQRMQQREERREEQRKERQANIDRRLARLRLRAQIGKCEYIRRQAADYFQRAMAKRGPEIRARKRELMRDPERRRKKREHDLRNRIKRTALFTALRERGWLRGNEIVDTP